MLIFLDIIFEGRVPFTGSADTCQWLFALEGLQQEALNWIIPGHGSAASDLEEAVRATLRCLRDTREIERRSGGPDSPFRGGLPVN